MTFSDFVIKILLVIKSFIFPQDISEKCENQDDPPPAEVFLSHLTVTQLVFLIVGSSLTLSTILVGIIHGGFVFKFVSSEKRRSSLYFLSSLLPVTSCCCLIGMYCPRTAMIVSSLGVQYFLLCFFLMISLMRHLAGGRENLSRSLQEESRMINYRSPPICCFLFCLPQSLPTVRNIKRLEFCVLQAPIVRGIIVFGQIVIVSEAREHALKWLQFFDLASLLSLLIAIFGIHTLARVTSERLSQFGFIRIFRMVDLALMFFTAQHPLLFQNILLRFHVIHCGAFLSSQDNARFICNFVTIVELAILTALSTLLLRPSRHMLLDVYSPRIIQEEGLQDDDRIVLSHTNTQSQCSL